MPNLNKISIGGVVYDLVGETGPQGPKGDKGDTGGIGMLTTFEDGSEAKSKFHQILSYAAVTTLFVHTAIAITDEGTLLMRECYKHNVTE